MLGTHELRVLLDQIDADSQIIHRALCAAYPSAAGVFLIPSGGEAHGYLCVTSLTVEDVPQLSDAVPALWKITQCLCEEWPYEPWTRHQIRPLIESYRSDWKTWLDTHDRKPSSLKWLAYLQSAVESVCTAQFGGAATRNPPTYLPNQAAVLDAELVELSDLSLETLQMVLSDQWNDVLGVFRRRDRRLMVGWGTNA